MLLFSILMRDFFFYEEDDEDIEFRLSDPDLLELLEVKTECNGRSKLRHMNGVGKRLLASMMNANPNKRFTLDWLNPQNILFDTEFSE